LIVICHLRPFGSFLSRFLFDIFVTSFSELTLIFGCLLYLPFYHLIFGLIAIVDYLPTLELIAADCIDFDWSADTWLSAGIITT
jgi:hypothetical protein